MLINITLQHLLAASSSSLYSNKYEPRHVGILTSVDLDEPVQPTFKLRNSKLYSASSLTVIEYSSD